MDNLGFPNDVVFSTDEILENPGFQFQGALINYVTNYVEMKKYCEQKFPDKNGPWGIGSPIFYERCALAHSNYLGD